MGGTLAVSDPHQGFLGSRWLSPCVPVTQHPLRWDHGREKARLPRALPPVAKAMDWWCKCRREGMGVGWGCWVLWLGPEHTGYIQLSFQKQPARECSQDHQQNMDTAGRLTRVRIPALLGPCWEVCSKSWNLVLATVSSGVKQRCDVGHFAEDLHTVGTQLGKALASEAHRTLYPGLSPWLGPAHECCTAVGRKSQLVVKRPLRQGCGA